MQQPPSVPHLLAQFDDFAARLGEALASDDIDWQWRPNPAAWSLTEVVCHLRDVEREVHQERFRILVKSDNPFLPGVTSDDWAETRDYRSQDGPAALADFLAARRQTVRLLRAQEEAIWERRGRHAFFGPTTMHELLNLAVKHDQTHWEQVQALLRQASHNE